MSHLSGQIVEFERFGFLIRFFVSNPQESIQRHHVAQRFYEEDDLVRLAELIPPPRRIIDVGANIGNHSIFFGTRFPDAEVVPVELFPEAVRHLEINLDLNRQVRVDKRALGVGLSDKPSRCGFVANHVNNRGLVKVSIDDQKGVGKLVSGDSLFRETGMDLLKIDVEGHELEVLNGLSETLKSFRPAIFIEVDEKNKINFEKWMIEQRYEPMEIIKRYAVNQNYILIPK